MCEDDRVSIDHPDELAALRAAGRVVAETIRELARRVRPGVTTGELDDVAARVFAANGARSGPQLDYDFPGVVCISVDDECVHGIGRRIHEEPDVPNVAWDGPPLTPGLVITIEPIIAAGAGDVYMDEDGWTVRTEDGLPSAHAEHTIVVTEAAPILVTA